MAEPITVDDAKAQLRVVDSTDDALIGDLITEAREHVEAYCGTRLIPGSVTMTFGRFEDLGRLTLAPVAGVTAIRYLDANGVEQTLDPSTYTLINVADDPLAPMIRLNFGKSWPSSMVASDAVRVDANVGYSVVPPPIIRAMKLLITQWYDYRTGVQIDARGVPAEVPNAVSSLLANYRA